MISELLNADHGTRNKLLQLTHNGLYPELRRGDYVIWQQVKGFVQEGYYVVDSGGEPNVYLVQNCGGLLRLICPDRDVEAATRKLKKNANPQEISPEKFAKFCLGFVVASLKVHHTGAFHQREALVARSFVRAREKATA